MDIREKNITIIGMGKSGIAAARLALKAGARLRVTDAGGGDSVRAAAADLKKQGAKTQISAHTEDFIKGADFVVTSPGVPDTAMPLRWAKKAGIKVMDEIEFACLFCKCPVIAVTGTNGKSTTTSLIRHILLKSGKKAVSCGNIGNPFSESVLDADKSCIMVLEASSFQLSRIDTFRPRVSVFLNIDDNHYDRHRDFAEYLAAKLNIFKNQKPQDTAVINAACAGLIENAAHIAAEKLYFSGEGEEENELAAAAAVSVFGVSRAQAKSAIATFKGLEHRCEYVRTIDGVDFINDSKSTTVASTIKALRACRGKILLIAGGKDKGLDYSRLLGAADFHRIKSVILIGRAADKIMSGIGGKTDARKAGSLKEAAELAFSLAEEGETVLLSPMCSSFDQFRSFEHRGEVFKEIVKKLHKCLMPN